MKTFEIFLPRHLGQQTARVIPRNMVLHEWFGAPNCHLMDGLMARQINLNIPVCTA